MKFQVGKFYQHNSGDVMHILARVDNCTGYFGPCLVAEGPDETGFRPVGPDEDAAVNWHEIPPHLYYRRWLKGNEDSAELQRLATDPAEDQAAKDELASEQKIRA